MIFHIGEQVGIRGWGNGKTTLLMEGPFTLARRPLNPYDQHIWEFVESPGATSESLLVPWIPGHCFLGGPVPSSKEIQTYYEAMRKVIHTLYETNTNQSADPGTGPADWIRGFLGV